MSKKESIAVKVMNKQNPEYSNRFEKIIEFIQANPEFAPTKKLKNKILDISSEEYINKLATSYCKGRKPPSFSVSQAVMDPAIETIVREVFKAEPDEAQELHKSVMSAENALGGLLENYIASVAEEKGWIFCPGSTVKSTDFIKPNSDGSYEQVQIKSADNSENSSSSKIREGTNIVEWHRKKAKTGETLWENFPDKELASLLNEEDFLKFVAQNSTIKDIDNGEGGDNS